jgi:hypothetical protein
MGIPDLTVDPGADGPPCVFESIADEARKAGMTDMDIFVAWSLGVAAYKCARGLSAKFPHDTTAEDKTPHCEMFRPFNGFGSAYRPEANCKGDGHYECRACYYLEPVEEKGG